MMKVVISQSGQTIHEFELNAGRSWTAGRGENCELRLSGSSGISRSHFRITEDGDQWVIQALSKFGEVLHQGRAVQQEALLPGSVFRVGDYEIAVHKAEAPAMTETVNQSVAVSTANSTAVGRPVNLPAAYQGNAAIDLDPFEGNNEATVVGPVLVGQPSVRIETPGKEPRVVKLDGKRWIAGREDGCEIPIDDAKASRRQFEIISSPQGYYIKDLGSSNGTILNGRRLEPDAQTPIVSGDSISVLKTSMIFEIIDPHFEKKLAVVPQELLFNPPVIAPPPYEIINYPIVSGPGGAVRVDAGGAEIAPWDFKNYKHLPPERRKKYLFYVALLGLVFFASLFYLTGDPAGPAPQLTEFARLTPAKQTEVKEAYLRAKNLHAQRKFSLALENIRQIHSVLPTGFEDSMQMLEEITRIEEIERQKAETEAMLRERQEIERLISATIAQCEPLAQRTTSVAEIQSCLQPAMMRDPGHSKLAEMIARVQARADALAAKLRMQEDYRRQVLRGKSLFFQAKREEAQMRLYEAKVIYQRHLSSDLPDPDNLKAQSRAAISRIDSRVRTDIGKHLTAARAALQNNSYREATDHIELARRVDSRNEDMLLLARQIRTEKDLKMQEIFAEATIQEGVGKLDQAKERWRDILKQDHPSGEYYKKSKAKLDQFGNLGDRQ
jgi:pSer/pThr/pTyr-binding forkhead associated (FHA) protein